MAEYTNLSTLSGLSVGDTITYNTDTSINLANATVTISMVGYRNQTEGGKGGWVSFNFDGSNLQENLYYRAGQRSALCYMTTNFSPYALEYYRIAVPGDTGYPSKDSDNATKNGGSGGLSIMNTFGAAGNGNDATAASLSKGRGGKLNAGGDGYPGGSFGAAGDNGLTGSFSGAGGYGWYGGGAGQSNGTNAASGGGGSSFVLSSTAIDNGAILPSGYMDDDSTLIQDLANRASNLQYTRSNTVSQSMGTMVITILNLTAPTITDITITSLPTKTEYVVNDTFDSTGLEVRAVYTDYSTEILSSSDYTLSTPDMSTTGTKTITVTYTDSNTQTTYTTSFDITVESLGVRDISLSGNYPRIFSLNDTFSSTGLIVTANYNNETSTTTNSYTLSNPDMTTSGSKTIKVTYTGNDGLTNDITTTYTIVVKTGTTYTNLASLSGLNPGDEVTYTADTEINFAGQNTYVEIYGTKAGTSSGYGNAGLVQFKLNTSDITSPIFYYKGSTYSYLRYGSTVSVSTDNYYRIAVPGNGGQKGSAYYGDGTGGDGGGLVGASGSGGAGTATGGTQTSGGLGSTSVGSYGGSGTNGSFGTGGYSGSSHGYRGGYGGYGWYGGGGGGCYNSSGTGYTQTRGSGGGGGSSFVLGATGTSYPSGYMDDDSTLIATLKDSISESSLTQGASTETAGKMTVVILSPDKSLDSIAVTTLPTKTTYNINETFDPTGLVITATYTDNSTAVIPSTDYTLSTPDMSTSGVKTITVTYTEGDITATTTFNITVTAALTGIEITNYPYTTVYAIGDTVDLTGLEVSAIYSDSSTEILSSSDYTVSTPDMTSTGVKTLTITYDTFTTTFDITVYTNVVSSITLDTTNAQTTFTIHQPFSYTGLVVTAVYTDGTSAVTTDFSVSNVNTNYTMTTQARVTYTGANKNGNITAAYSVTIVGYRNLTSLEGLFINDSIEYYGTPSSVFTDIDFKNWTVEIAMEGSRNQSKGGRGGRVTFQMDTNGLGHFGYRNERSCLVYKATGWSSKVEYYRIAVPGDTGYPATDGGSVLGNGGSGGLQSGFSGNAGNGVTSGETAGRGASITSGGEGVSEYGKYNTYGQFGNGGPGILYEYQSATHSSRAGSGGYGWYGGSGGYIRDDMHYASGGGGSSFVLSNGSDGVSVDTTQSIPSGYMGDDSTLIANLASKISYTNTARSASKMTEGAGGKMTVRLLSKNIESIYNVVYPTKRTYAYGEIKDTEDIDLSGMSATVEFSDGEISTLHDWNFYPTSHADIATATGDQDISINVDGYGQVGEYTIYINPENTVLVNSLTLSGNYQTTYELNDTFNTTNLVVTASYSDGTSAVLSANDYTISSPNMGIPGTQTVTITYTGLNTSGPVTASYDITINSVAALRYYDNTTQTFVPCEVYYCTGVQKERCNITDHNYTNTGNENFKYLYDNGINNFWKDESSDNGTGKVYIKFIPRSIGTYEIKYQYSDDRNSDVDGDLNSDKVTLHYYDEENDFSVYRFDIDANTVNQQIKFYAEFEYDEGYGEHDGENEIDIYISDPYFLATTYSPCEVYIYDGTEFKKSQG